METIVLPSLSGRKYVHTIPRVTRSILELHVLKLSSIHCSFAIFFTSENQIFNLMEVKLPVSMASFGVDGYLICVQVRSASFAVQGPKHRLPFFSRFQFCPNPCTLKLITIRVCGQVIISPMSVCMCVSLFWL